MLAILDRAPMRAAHHRIWLLSTGGTMLGGFSVFTLGVAFPLLVRHFAIDATLEGLIGAALLLGAVPGSALGGPLADRLGRKPLMIVDMAIIATGALLCVFASDATMLLIGLFVLGIGVGIDYPVSSAYVAEWMPIKVRSRILVATMSFQAVGFLLAGASTAAVLWLVDTPAAWRGFMICMAAIPLLILALRLPLRESPRWFMGKGRNVDAARTIADVLDVDRAKLDALGAAAAHSVHVVAKVPAHVLSRGLGALFSRPYVTRTTLACVPWFLMDMASYGIGLFTPVLLGALHFGGGSHGTVAADFSDIKGATAIDLFLLVGFLLGVWAIPHFGHLRLQIFGFCGMIAGMLVLLTALWACGATPCDIGIFSGFILFNLAMNMGPHSTTFALPAELFPTQLRGAGSGLASATAKIGAALGVFLLPTVKYDFGIPAILVLMAVVSLAGALVTALCAESLGGEASLEERHAGVHLAPPHR